MYVKRSDMITLAYVKAKQARTEAAPYKQLTPVRSDKNKAAAVLSRLSKVLAASKTVTADYTHELASVTPVATICKGC